MYLFEKYIDIRNSPDEQSPEMDIAAKGQIPKSETALKLNLFHSMLFVAALQGLFHYLPL